MIHINTTPVAVRNIVYYPTSPHIGRIGIHATAAIIGRRSIRGGIARYVAIQHRGVCRIDTATTISACIPNNFTLFHKGIRSIDATTATIGRYIVLNPALRRHCVLLQVCARTAPRCITVLYREPVPLRPIVELKRLVQHPPCILSVQHGGVGLKIALRQVKVRWLDARKTTIYIHSVTHRKGIGCRCVAVVGASGHPHHSIMRHCKGLCLLDGGDGIGPAVAGVCARTRHRHINDAVIHRNRHAVVVRLVAAQIDRVAFDTGRAVQVEAVGHERVAAAVGAD